MAKILKMLRDLGVDSIAKRVFATNGIDSLLSAIGVLSGTSSVANPQDPAIYVGAVLGGALSLGLLSGFLGVLITERSERLKELREIEKSMASSLADSMYAKAVNYASLYVALWSLVGSLGLPLTVLIPLILSLQGFLYLSVALKASLMIAYIELFLLGIYMGRGASPIKVAIQYLMLGIIATLITSFVGSIL